MAGRSLRVTVGTVPDLPWFGTVPDDMAIADVVNAAAARVRSADDPLAVTDLVSSMTAAVRSTPEAIGIADAVSAVLGGAGLPLTLPFTL